MKLGRHALIEEATEVTALLAERYQQHSHLVTIEDVKGLLKL